MKLLFGGKSSRCQFVTASQGANVFCSITRLMGESFKLHSQALVGYVDDPEASSNVSTPSMTSQGADEDSVY